MVLFEKKKKGEIFIMGRCCCCCCGNQGTGNAQSEINYSFDEQFTGKLWVDGKKIYQKTIDIGSLPDNVLKSVSHGIPNIDYIVDYKGIAKGTYIAGTIFWGKLPYPYPDSEGSVCVAVLEDRIDIVTQIKDYWGRAKGYVTIFYTCTDR